MMLLVGGMSIVHSGVGGMGLQGVSTSNAALFEEMAAAAAIGLETAQAKERVQVVSVFKLPAGEGAMARCVPTARLTPTKKDRKSVV